MAAEPPKAPSGLRRLAWLVIPLLLLVLASNREGLLRAWRGESPEAVQDGRQEPSEDREFVIEIPRDTGAPDAKVLFEVFLERRGRCTCHVENAALGEAVGRLDPQHLRVRFRDLTKPETRDYMRKLGSPLPGPGFAVNGKYKFTVPTMPPEPKGTRQVDFLSYERKWVFDDIYEALAQEYQANYHKAPPLDKSRFVKDISAAAQRAYAQAAPDLATPPGDR